MYGKSIFTFATSLRRGTLMAALLCGTAMAGVSPAAAQGQFYQFPEITYFGAMSDDGRVIVGRQLDRETGRSQAAVGRYGDDGYMFELLGTLGGNNSHALDVSGDGTTIVGEAEMLNGYYRAFRVSAAGGEMQNLGTLNPLLNAHSFGLGVSDDGRRVVGYSTQGGRAHGFVWIEGADGGVDGNEQMFQLNELDGGYGRSEARAISGDGRYVVGYSDADATTSLAVRWYVDALDSGRALEIERLGSLIGDTGWSVANAISRDGRTVVGTSGNHDGNFRAFIWREGADNGSPDNRQMLEIGTLGGNSSYGLAISGNGNWVVGESSTGDGADAPLAFRWSEETGIESVDDWMERNGVETDGVLLVTAAFISDDGSIVGGDMFDSENGQRAYIARVDDEHGGGVMDVENYQRSLTANASAAGMGEFLNWLPLNGAHHRPLMLQPTLDGDTCVWATGDFARHEGDRANLALAEVGACAPVADAVTIGAGIGTSHAWQDLSQGGDARFDGRYLMGEIDWKPQDAPLVFSLTGVAGSWDVEIRRGYSNGAATAYSEGETGAYGGAVRARVDWLDAAVLGNTSINPFASIGIGSVHLGGYTETGGPFPARFDAQTLTTREVRLGVTAVTEITQAVTLSTTLEAVHRHGDAPGASGQALGLFGLDLGGGTSSQTWLRAGAEIDYRVSESAVVSASFNAASAGRDATVSGSIGFRAEF